MYSEAKQRVEKLIDREVDVVQTEDGMYVVEWFNFNTLPPPKGINPLEALTKFEEYFVGLGITKENT